jgi:hypothetical protein
LHRELASRTEEQTRTADNVAQLEQQIADLIDEQERARGVRNARAPTGRGICA